MAKKKGFEQALKRLEEIVKEMEDENTDLEKSVKLYKEGIELSVFCGESLNNIEQEITVLQRNANGLFTQNKFEFEDREDI